MDDSTYYTHAEWRVRPGSEEDFVAEWQRLGETFSALPRPPYWGTLLRSETDPSVFYSFGPWASAEDVAAMRANPAAQAAIQRISELCESATPGPCRCVAHIDIRN